MRGIKTPAGTCAARDSRCEFDRDEPAVDDDDEADEREPSDEELADDVGTASDFERDDDQLADDALANDTGGADWALDGDEPDLDDDFDVESDDDWPCTDRLGAADEG